MGTVIFTALARLTGRARGRQDGRALAPGGGSADGSVLTLRQRGGYWRNDRLQRCGTLACRSLLHMAIWAAALTVLGLLFVTLGTGMQAVATQHEYRNLQERWLRGDKLEFSKQVHPSRYGGGHTALESVALWLTQQFRPVATVGWYLLGFTRIPKIWNNVSETDVDELARFTKQAVGWTLLLLGSVAGLAAACISLATQ